MTSLFLIIWLCSVISVTSSHDPVAETLLKYEASAATAAAAKSAAESAAATHDSATALQAAEIAAELANLLLDTSLGVIRGPGGLNTQVLPTPYNFGEVLEALQATEVANYLPKSIVDSNSGVVQGPGGLNNQALPPTYKFGEVMKALQATEVANQLSKSIVDSNADVVQRSGIMNALALPTNNNIGEDITVSLQATEAANQLLRSIADSNADVVQRSGSMNALVLPANTNIGEDIMVSLQTTEAANQLFRSIADSQTGVKGPQLRSAITTFLNSKRSSPVLPTNPNNKEDIVAALQVAEIAKQLRSLEESKAVGALLPIGVSPLRQITTMLTRSIKGNGAGGVQGSENRSAFTPILNSKRSVLVPTFNSKFGGGRLTGLQGTNSASSTLFDFIRGVMLGSNVAKPMLNYVERSSDVSSGSTVSCRTAGIPDATQPSTTQEILKGLMSDAVSKSLVTECHPGEVVCTDNKHCIKLEYQCDGYNDCEDGSDELECGVCLHWAKHCADNRQCVRDKAICDLKIDCLDSSDELNCSLDNGRKVILQEGSITCSEGQILCGDQSKCIPKLYLCDGEEDCPNSSDEINCPTCRRRSVLCANGEKCIRDIHWCDGVKSHCNDGSDEAHCTGIANVKNLNV